MCCLSLIVVGYLRSGVRLMLFACFAWRLVVLIYCGCLVYCVCFVGCGGSLVFVAYSAAWLWVIVFCWVLLFVCEV